MTETGSSALPIAAVVGSTGTQGLSVTKALSKAGYHVRALTRSPTSPKTLSAIKDLQNVEPIHFDIEDRASVERAFEGAAVVFGLSIPDLELLTAAPKTFVSHQMGEEAQGKRLADVAKEKGVGIFVWSTLPEALPREQEKYPGVDFRASKLRVNEYIKSIGLPAVFVALGFFNNNFINYGAINLNSASEIVYSLQHASLDLPLYAHVSIGHDLGPIVALLVRHFHSHNLKYKSVVAIERFYSAQEILDIISKVTGKKAILDIPEAYGAKGSTYDDMFKAFADPETPYADWSLVPDKTLTQELGFKFQTVEEFVRESLAPYLGLEVVA